MLKNFSMHSFIKAQLELGAELKRVNLPLSTSKWLHIIHFSMPNLNHGFYGLGADSVEELAYIKAIVEYFERMAFFEIGIKLSFDSTSGIAGHRMTYFAKRNAISELYERDSFLLHWYSQTPFLKVKTDIKFLEMTFAELVAQKVKPLFFKTFLGHQETYVCFLINKETGGFAIGLSSGKTHSENMKKSFSEALINYFLGNQGKTKEELLNNLESEGLSSLKNHRTYWLHYKLIPEWILKQSHAHRLEINKIKPIIKNHFSASYGPIKVEGIQLSEIFTLSLGHPNNNDWKLLTQRIKYFKQPFNEFVMNPHPIP